MRGITSIAMLLGALFLSVFAPARAAAQGGRESLADGILLQAESISAKDSRPLHVIEEPHDVPPFRTLPHPDEWEQLWHPGDLVEDTYFLRRPWHTGFFVGTMDGDQLASNIDQSSDWFGGVRWGNDFAPHWGWEIRSAFFTPNLVYFDEPLRQDFSRDWFLDVNVVHYPWGDTRIRPFWSIGLGGAQYKYSNDVNLPIRDWVIDLPLSIGCKYHWKPWLALRGELTDTITFGNPNLETMNNLSFSLGAEVHWHSFKTRPVRYGY